MFSNPNKFAQTKIKEVDFIFLLSVLIVDGSDNFRTRFLINDYFCLCQLIKPLTYHHLHENSAL